MISKSVFIKKKRIMEKFNLEKYLANPSRKVVTRNGRNARIISTDMNSKNYPIVALVKLSDNTTEDVWTYTKDGEFEVEQSTTYDLFFAPEKHEGWVNLYKWLGKEYTYHMGNVYNSKAEAENGSSNNNYKYVATIRIEWEE